MPNQSLTDLPERTSTSGSDRIHVNNAGTDYQQTKENFLKGDFQHIFNNTSALTAQVDALPVGTFFGSISAYGSQTTTGLPINANCYVKVTKMSSTTASIEIWSSADVEGQHYITTKTSNTWGSWVHVPNRSEISALNNSLTKSSGTFSVSNGTVSSDKLYKFNDLVVFQFTFVASSNIPSGSSGQGFVTFPSGYRPEVGIGISGQLGTGQANYFISSNGTVQCGTAISSGQAVRLSGSFISA